MVAVRDIGPLVGRLWVNEEWFYMTPIRVVIDDIEENLGCGVSLEDAC